MILADVLSLATRQTLKREIHGTVHRTELSPKLVMDFATLTGQHYRTIALLEFLWIGYIREDDSEESICGVIVFQNHVTFVIVTFCYTLFHSINQYSGFRN